MSQTKVVSIGGIEYDSHTGLPTVVSSANVNKVQKHPTTSASSRNTQAVHAKGVHTTQQRSTTLNRRFVASNKPSNASTRPQVRKNLDFKPRVSRSAHISKFAPEPQSLAVKRPVVTDIAAKPHPVVKKAHNTQATKATPVTAAAPTAKDIKHAELGKALANAKPETKAPKKPRGRALNVAAASLGLLLIAGYFTYVNMPNLSVRVAAAQAGINASFPEYRPIGYRLNGPVAYQDGEVSMKFASNSGPLAFSLSQSTSAWDSAALLEKYVNPRSESRYATYSDGGLTIYTYGTNAAWVNGGILYTIEGTANLSNEQIRRIATSM
jgi:hypothetical protein